MVGLALASAHCLVGGAFSGWKLDEWDESCGSAGKTLVYTEHPLFHSLDG